MSSDQLKMTQELEEEEELEQPNSSKKKKKKKRKSTEPRKRAAKRAWLSLAKPSYGLSLGSRNLRFESRARLTRLLRSLVSQRCWTEACGVLSVLLKSTPRDTSLLNNRFKYSALMEVLANLGDEYLSEGKIKNIYHLWIRKIGSLKNPQDENRFVVRLEFIVFCLTQGNVDDAHQAALWLMQERNFGRDPTENMVVGLTFHQLWFSTIPKDLLWTRDIESSTPEQSRDLIAYSGADTNEVSTGFQCDSVSSVGNDKILAADGDEGNPVRVDIIKVENLPQNNQALAISAESTGNETSTSNRADVSPYTSTLSALEGLSPSFFPIQLPRSIGDGEDLYHLHMKLLNDYHKEALKYLSIALHSTPPALEALLPYIQLLLVGGKVGEALSELDKLSCNSSATLPIRLRASILEHFDRSNIAALSTCFEDILKKDPTCGHALEKLITMHQNGEYSYESLLEMIAWHLDSTYASHETWKELASCFLKLSENEEDQMSVCQDGNQGERESVSFSTIPKVFTQGAEGKNWRLRCRWWLNRHFNCNTLASEIASGDLELPGYKAACASHIYGPELAYVVDVYSCLEKQNETDLFLFLKQNIKKSIQLYSSFKQN